MINFVSVYCNQENCRYNQDKRCNTTGIQISSIGFCESYEEEELLDMNRPDSERDLQE